MEYGFLGIIPVIVLLGMAIWTRKCISSMIMGCIIGCIIIGGTGFLTTFVDMIYTTGCDADTVWILVLLDVYKRQAYGDQHPRFGYPNSANDVDELLDFFTVLKEEGLMRKDDPLVLSMEVKPWGSEDPEIIIANTKRVINRAWALLEE